jgi:multidrug resistance protein, MATE family
LRRRQAFFREVRDLLWLATPIVVSQLGQIGMNTADTIMVGPLGSVPLAAAGIGSAIHSFGVLLCTGIIMGMTPLVSQAFGSGDAGTCRRVLVQGIWLAALVTIPVAWSAVVGGDIARMLGQDEEVARLAGDYLLALVPGVLPLFLFTAFRQYLDAMGRAMPTMVMTFIGLAVNIAANRVLIYGVEGWVPAMGMVGSGWATTIVRWAMLVGMVAYLLLHPKLSPFRGVRWRVDIPLLRRITHIGAPVGAQFGLEVGLFAFAAIMMGWLGPTELAAHQVTLNIAATTFMVALGTSMAGSIRVGQHIGAARSRAMRRSIGATYLVVTAFMAACALVFVLAPAVLIRIYTPDPAILEIGVRLLLVAAFFQVFDGAQVAGMSVLRGAGDTQGPMRIALAGYWLFGVPVALLLGFRTDLGPVGVWIGLSVGLAAVALLLVFRVRSFLIGDVASMLEARERGRLAGR